MFDPFYFAVMEAEAAREKKRYRPDEPVRESEDLYIHAGFDPKRTKMFADGLAFFENAHSTGSQVYKDRVNACLSSIADPKVDTSAYYLHRDWFRPYKNERVPPSPIALFSAAVVTAPPAVIQAMADRPDTNINAITKGPPSECNVGPFGFLVAHIEFRDKRDNRDSKKDGWHTDTVEAIRIMFSEPRFYMVLNSFVPEWNAFAALSLDKSPYEEIAEQLLMERTDILASTGKEAVASGLNEMVTSIFDNADFYDPCADEPYNYCRTKEDKIPLTQLREQIRELSLELFEPIGTRIHAHNASNERVFLLDSNKLLAGATDYQKREAVKKMAGRLFAGVFTELFVKKWPTEHRDWKGRPETDRDPVFRGVNKLATAAWHRQFGC